MEAPGFEKEEECVELKKQYLWFCCMSMVGLIALMECNVWPVDGFSKPHATLTHSAIYSNDIPVANLSDYNAASSGATK